MFLTFAVSLLPLDIWIQVLVHCDLRTMIQVETTCHTLRDVIQRVASLVYRKEALGCGYMPLQSSATRSIFPRALASLLRKQDRSWSTGDFQHAATLPDIPEYEPYWISGDCVVRMPDPADISTLEIFRMGTGETFPLSVCDPRDLKHASAVDITYIPEGDFIIHAASVPIISDVNDVDYFRHTIVHFRSLSNGPLFRGHMYTHRLVLPFASKVIFAASWGPYIALFVRVTDAGTTKVRHTERLMLYDWSTGDMCIAEIQMVNPSRNVVFLDDNHLLISADHNANGLDLYRFNTKDHTISFLRSLHLPREACRQPRPHHLEFLSSGPVRQTPARQNNSCDPLHTFDDVEGGILVVLLTLWIKHQDGGGQRNYVATDVLLAINRSSLRRYASDLPTIDDAHNKPPISVEWEEWGSQLACLVPMGSCSPENIVVSGPRVLGLGCDTQDGCDDVIVDFSSWLGIRNATTRTTASLKFSGSPSSSSPLLDDQRSAGAELTHIMMATGDPDILASDFSPIYSVPPPDETRVQVRRMSWEDLLADYPLLTTDVRGARNKYTIRRCKLSLPVPNLKEPGRDGASAGEQRDERETATRSQGFRGFLTLSSDAGRLMVEDQFIDYDCGGVTMTRIHFFEPRLT